MSGIANKIEDLCQIHRMKLEDLESELGFEEGAIREWDISSPSIDKLMRVANHFSVSIDDLMDFTPQSHLSGEAAARIDALMKENEELRQRLRDIQTLARF